MFVRSGRLSGKRERKIEDQRTRGSTIRRCRCVHDSVREGTGFPYERRRLHVIVRPKNVQSHSLAVKGGGGTSGATACGAAAAAGACARAVRGFFGATRFLAMALRFFFNDFLAADFNSRVRIVFFVAALRFLGMGIPFVTGVIWRRPYNAYLRGGQTVGTGPTATQTLQTAKTNGRSPRGDRGVPTARNGFGKERIGSRIFIQRRSAKKVALQKKV